MFQTRRGAAAKNPINNVLNSVSATPVRHHNSPDDARIREDSAHSGQEDSMVSILTGNQKANNHDGPTITPGIQPGGESGRTGINFLQLMKICWRSSSRASSAVNVLWPIVPVAIALSYICPDLHLACFILNYIAMVPCANLVGFAGAEAARKLHKVIGILLETTLGSVVEIVMFLVLIKNNQFRVIRAAILGSVLATQLLCLGLCFVFGGIRHDAQEFDEAVGEVGSDLLLTAGFGLIIPAAFYTAIRAGPSGTEAELLADKVLHISRYTAILLIISYVVYVFFQMRTHESIYDTIFEAEEIQRSERYGAQRLENGEEVDFETGKLTFTECVFALTAAVSLVTIIAISLVTRISFIVKERGVSDAFVGLILVPLVEKFAEHLTAINEAWNNEMNMAIAHVLGATTQTSLFNGPLVVLVGWALDKPMDLNFDLFSIVVLILAILVVGNFLRDQKSNYLEGSLCVIVYINIAIAVFWYPDPKE